MERLNTVFYPLLLKPPVKDYLWGGTRLKIKYNYETDKEKALDMTKREKPQIPYGNTGKTEKTPYGTVRKLTKVIVKSAPDHREF